MKKVKKAAKAKKVKNVPITDAEFEKLSKIDSKDMTDRQKFDYYRELAKRKPLDELTVNQRYNIWLTKNKTL